MSVQPYVNLLQALLLLLVLCLPLPAQGQTAPPETAVAKASLREVLLTAFTRARTEMTVVTEFGGKVLSVAADVGQPVPGDGIFARLDATFIRLDLQNNAVEQERTRSEIDYYRKEVARYETLVANNHAPQATLDELKLKLDQSLRGLDSLRVAEATSKEQLRRYAIETPAGWLVVRRLVEPGEWVQPGQELAVVGDFGELIAPFALAPEEFAWLKAAAIRGDGTLTLSLPDYGDREVPATIYQIDPSFDPETRKVGVELSLGSTVLTNGDARGGVRVALNALVPDASGAVTLPLAFLRERYEEHWAQRENGELVRVVLLSRDETSGAARLTSPEITPGDVFVRPAALAEDESSATPTATSSAATP